MTLKVLSEPDVIRIHEASLKLLWEHGLLSESDVILEVFKRGGASVDRAARMVRLPADLVEAALKSAPKSFVLCGREPRFDIHLEVGKVYFGMGGTPEPFIWDYDGGVSRAATKADMVTCTRIGHALENIDFILALCSAGDVPREESYLHEYDAILRNTTKPVVYVAPGQQYAAHYLEMAAAACGGEEILRQRPSIVLFTQPVSPLQIGRYSEGMLEAAKYGIPILFSPGPMMGATSPATLAGTLVQVNAEALFGIVLSQLLKEGTPVIYGPHTGAMDMATAQCTYGSPEQTLARAAVAQLAGFYGVPSFGLGGGVEAKIPDAEAASEAMMGMLTNALAGLTLTQTLGTMASGLYGSLEMLVLCDEMARMVRRITAGIPVTEETLALNVIQSVGSRGSFLGEEHTLRTFRRELYFPQLFRRQSIDDWAQAGSRPIDVVAHQRVLDILSRAGSIALPSGADAALERALRRAIQDVREVPHSPG